MKRMDRAALESANTFLDKTGLVQRVGVNRDLDVKLVGDSETDIDCGRSGAPVLVELQADRARQHLLSQWFCRAAVSFAEKPEIHRIRFGRLEHTVQVPPSRRAGRRKRPRRGTSAAAEHRRHAGTDRLIDLLRTNEMNVAVDSACRDD